MRRYFGGEYLLRKGRYSEAGRVYLVTTNTFQRKPFLRSLRLGRSVVRALLHADQEQWTRTLAFVVMPDHLHWLFRLEGRKDLSSVIASIKGYSAWRMRRQRPHFGQVWQRGFHDRAIRGDEDLRALARYVVANPLRAELVEDLGRYPFWDAVWLEPTGSALDILDS